MAKYTTRVFIDSDDMLSSPRDWDNLGEMICFHGRYQLGDKHSIDHRDFDGWESMEAFLSKTYPVMLPMYLYDHSGITVRTTPFSCRFDSGQIGFIVASRENIKKWYNVKRLTKKVLERAEEALRQEVSTYDSFISNDVYGYNVEDEAGEIVDSCGGIIGVENVLNEIPKEYQENITWA
jgi:hypothetical protein